MNKPRCHRVAQAHLKMVIVPGRHRWSTLVFVLLLTAMLQPMRADQTPSTATETGKTETGKTPVAEATQTSVVVIVGAPGTAEYEQQFVTWAGRWQTAAETAAAHYIGIGSEASADRSDRERIRLQLEREPKTGAAAMWLILIGHGTYDRQQAKFNVRGPDFTAKELANWLTPFQRPVVVVNCASSSAPFIKQLSAPGRVIVTSTKSGSEQNYCRFGDYFSAAINDPQADLDKDEQVSVLEAYLAAAAGVREFYKQQSRLATEHALLDDNGDGLATPADWFQGVRATRAAKKGAETDGLRANQLHLIRSPRERNLPAPWRRARNALELKIAQLQKRKSELAEVEYYRELEQHLVELARLYQQADPPRP
ncbi:MAG: hypothetical protein ABGZ35_15610 [Planctomycetaceae bacterium]